MVPGDRPLIAIGYKYNMRKVLSFIITDNAGSTNTVITDLSKYPKQCTIVAISLLIFTLLCKNKTAVKEVDSQKKI